MSPPEPTGLLELVEDELRWISTLEGDGDGVAVPGDPALVSEYLQAAKLLPLLLRGLLEEDLEGHAHWITRMDALDETLAAAAAERMGEQAAERAGSGDPELLEAVAAAEWAFTTLWTWVEKADVEPGGHRSQTRIDERRGAMFRLLRPLLPGAGRLTEATVRLLSQVVAAHARRLDTDAEIVGLARELLLPTLAAWPELGTVRKAMNNALIAGVLTQPAERRGPWLAGLWDLVEAVSDPPDAVEGWVVSTTGLVALAASSSPDEARRLGAGPRLETLVRSWGTDAEGEVNLGWALVEALSWATTAARRDAAGAARVVSAVADLPAFAHAHLPGALLSILRPGRRLGRQGAVPEEILEPVVDLAVGLLHGVDETTAPELADALVHLSYQAAATGEAAAGLRILAALEAAEAGRWTPTLARSAAALAVTLDGEDLDRLVALADRLRGERDLGGPATAEAYADLVVTLDARLRRADPERARTLISRLEEAPVDGSTRKTLDEALARAVWSRWEEEPADDVDGKVRKALAAMDRLAALRERSRAGLSQLVECAEFLAHNLEAGDPDRMRAQELGARARGELSSRSSPTPRAPSELEWRSADAETAVDAEAIDGILHGIRDVGADDPAWPLGPVYPGRWRAPEPTEASRIVRAILAVPEYAARLQALEPYLLRVEDPPFYTGVSFVELALRLDGGEPASLCFLLAEDRIVQVDGTSPPVHELNAAVGVELDTAEQAGAYLRFFCSVVCGEAGSFMVVDDVSDIAFAEDADAGERGLVEAALVPVELRLEEDGGTVVSPIQYSDALFKATLSIYPTGMVQMQSDEPLLADLPVLSHGFWDGVRQLRRLRAR